MKLLIVSIILVHIAGLLSQAKFNAEEKAYLFINSQLPKDDKVHFAHEYDNQLALQKAQEMLTVERKRFFKNRHLVSALEQLLELQKLDNGDVDFQCGREAQDILRRNNRGVRNQSCVWWPSYTIRIGIETLVHNYCLRHAEQCKDTHLSKFKEVQGNIKEEFKALELIFGKAIGWRLSHIKSGFKVDTARVMKELISIETISPEEMNILLKDVFRSNNMAEAQDKLLDSILWPCMMYMDRLKQKGFDLAVEDFKVIEPQTNDGDTNLNFYYTVGNFNLCKVVTEKKSQLYDEIVRNF